MTICCYKHQLLIQIINWHLDSKVMAVATTDNKLLKKISLYQVCGDVHQVNKKHYDSVKR